MQNLQWNEILTCSICCDNFSYCLKLPITLACGHTICKTCLSKVQLNYCPFDKNAFFINPKYLPVNKAILLLTCDKNAHKVDNTVTVQNLKNILLQDYQYYSLSITYTENIALLLKSFSKVGKFEGYILSRSIQRKLISLLTCQILETEGRNKIIKICRSVGERVINELLVKHQNSQQLTGYLWGAIRSKGCQFLGPAMQEEALKLILLALEDGSALSRQVLVLFIVQRLKPYYSQVSKTSVGEEDSSLLQLKEEFRSYEYLRREHDSQIVQIAIEANLRINPDQWSSLLYGDLEHKSHMQSIVDKLQTEEQFKKSITDLIITLQRIKNPEQLSFLVFYFEILESTSYIKENESYTWNLSAKVLNATYEILKGFINFMKHQHFKKHANEKQLSTFHSELNSNSIMWHKDIEDMHSTEFSASTTNAHSPLLNNHFVKYLDDDLNTDSSHRFDDNLWNYSCSKLENKGIPSDMHNEDSGNGKQNKYLLMINEINNLSLSTNVRNCEV